jgi:hypothetical protein
MDPSTTMVLTFNAETIEIGSISGKWIFEIESNNVVTRITGGVGGTGGSGDTGGVGGVGAGPTLNLAGDVRWKSLSGELPLPEHIPSSLNCS